MINRSLLCADSIESLNYTEIFKFLASEHASGNVLNGLGNTVNELGFTTWGEKEISGAPENELRKELTAYGVPIDNSYRIGRASPTLRAITPIAGWFEISRGGSDDTGLQVKLHLFANSTETFANFVTTTKLDTTHNIPVGVTVEVKRASSTTASVHFCSRLPGDTTPTRTLVHASMPYTNGAGGKRVGIEWVNGEVVVYYENIGGGSRVDGTPIALSPTPWQTGDYGSVGVSYATVSNSGRPFLRNIYVTT